MDDQHLAVILKSALDSHPGDPPNEIEFSLAGFIPSASGEARFDNNWNLGINRYGTILKGFIKKFKLENPKPTVMITVSSNQLKLPDDQKARARITDPGDNKTTREFCITNKCNPEHTVYEIKKRQAVHNLPQYGVRIRHATETTLKEDDSIRVELDEHISSRKVPKHYRYAQRYSLDLGPVGSNGTKLQIDFSSVKANGKPGAFSFSGAQIVGMCANKVIDRYEVEVELYNEKGITRDDLEEIIQDVTLKAVLQFIVSQVQGGNSKKIQDGYDIALNFRNYVIMCRQQSQGRDLDDVEIGDIITQQNLVDAAGYFMGPSIATINRDTLKKGTLMPLADEKPQYYFTDKADGERCLMLITEKGQCFLIKKSGIMLGTRREGLTRTLTFVPTDLTVEVKVLDEPLIDVRRNFKGKMIKDTVLDGELLEIDDKFYFLSFDIIVHQGVYVNMASFNERLKILRSITGESDTLSLRVKKFTPYHPEEFKAFVSNKTAYHQIRDPDTGEVIEVKYTDNGITYDLDGIVFQPAHDKYPMFDLNWVKVLKYKPIRMLTVDQHLSYDRKLEHTDGNKLGMPPVENPQVYGTYIASCQKGKDLVPSRHKCHALIIDGYPRTTNREPINRGDIVECRMVVRHGEPYWEPMRIRHDKHKPNSIKVYQHVMDQFHQPIQISNFCTEDGGFGSKLNVADHNRWISNHFIISRVREIKRDNIRLLDLACGNIKSGSSWITIQKGFNKGKGKRRSIKIVGVDNCRDSATNIDTCKIYMSNLNASSGVPLFDPDNYDFYQENIMIPLHQSENRGLREQTLVKGNFNVVTCIFAIYYTFGSEKDFRAFLYNVAHNLKMGGIFICSYMNGSEVKKLFTKSDEAIGYHQSSGKKKLAWKLKDVKPSESPFGHEIKVTLNGLYTNNEEYLVDLTHPHVIGIINDYGLTVRASAPFDKTSKKHKLSHDEQTWAGLHTNICFEKTKEPITVSSTEPKAAPTTAPTGTTKKTKIIVKAIKAKPKAKPRKAKPKAKPKAKARVDPE